MATHDNNSDAVWRMGPVSGPLCAGIVAAIVVLLGETTPMPWWLPALLTAFGVAGALTRAVRLHHPLPALIFHLACWFTAACWTSWTILAGWSWGAFGVLVGGTVVAGIVSTVLSPAGVAQARAMTPDEIVADSKEGLAYLVNGLAGLKTTTAVITKLGMWDNGNGWRAVGHFPYGTLRTVQVLVDRQGDMAGALHLAKGCTVAVEEGDHQGQFVIDAMTVNRLNVERMYAADSTPSSIDIPQEIGTLPNGERVTVDIYQSSTIINGRRGAGKTVLLNVMTAKTLMCKEPVVCHIDLNGGGMAAPWMLPWLYGQVEESPLFWVAPGPAEALVMAHYLTEIAMDRKSRYAGLCARLGVDILPLDQGVPPIYIYVDEGGQVMGEGASRVAKMAAAKLRDLQQIGRSMLVNVIFSVQRATLTYVPSDMKKGCAQFISGMVTGKDELAHLFDWGKKNLSADALTSPGQGYIMTEKITAPRQFQWDRILPKQIKEVATVSAQWRPQTLDKGALSIVGDVLDERWGRIRPWLDRVAERDEGPAYDYLPLLNEITDGAFEDDVRKSKQRSSRRVVQALADDPREVRQAIDDLFPRKGVGGAPAQPAPATKSTEPVADDAPLTPELTEALDWIQGLNVTHDRGGMAPQPEQAGQDQAPAPQPAPADPGEKVAPGRLFVRQLIKAEGQMTTRAIRQRCIEAGHMTAEQRRQTLNDWLKLEMDLGNVAPVDGEFAAWQWTGN